MANFGYNRDIPDGPNNPSNDQPLMKENTNSIDSLLEVDHVSFEAENGGTHKQVTISSKNAAGAQADPASTVYSDNGIANATHPQIWWRNSQRIFPLSAVRAFASFTAANGALTIDNGFNVVSVTGAAFSLQTKTATIVLETGAVNGNDVVVFVFASNPLGVSTTISYSFADPTLTVNGLPNSQTANILVMQI